MFNFFKVITDKTLQDQQLKLPPKFVRKCKKNLPDLIVLEVPDGKTWEMKLEKDDDGKVWLRKGWPEFAHYYSIRKGYFLVFKYNKEKSNFHVCILDENTSTDIDYPTNRSKTTANNIQGKIETESDNDDDDDHSVQILDYFPKYQTGWKREPTESLRSQKVKRNRTGIDHRKETKARQITKPSVPERNLKCYRSILPENKGLKFPKQKGIKRGKQTKILHHLTVEDKARAIKRAKAFRSKYPLFEVVMQPTYASGMYLIIPTGFAQKHLGNQRRKLILRNSDGKTWRVQYIYEANARPKAKLSSGWRQFARENGVEVGDVCVVEFIKDKRIYSLRVNIF
ncbi:B3 domain-containing transcription factor VRN1-like [Ziziphus jujuba]|uniref:B3 domain-containing transcription factor VRN1-like n=1 Tax=Ziziphus jujuba TaxID=326968 RepID=A0A6P6GEQ1_ZIZJJ|nr:B3 domain-containing transcription factor VRN1-like [Ziziphus jujuba]